MQVKGYDVFMDIDFSGLAYKGKVLIELESDHDVLLNSVGLEIVRIGSGQKSFEYAQRDEDLTVHTGPFNGILTVEYAGSIPDSLAGIYRAPYDHTHIVTTHFEPAQARRMLPCVDRPDVKAVFKMRVRLPKDLDAISNMPVESVTGEGEKKTVTFQKTPRMSTYLLYLGVGKFEQHADRVGNIEVTIGTIPGKAKLGAFAQDEAKKAMKLFESYYGIPYGLPKIHLLAVPEFAMGAMENWGAITFRESALLLDANSSTRTRKRISEVVAHELAHQWFGDLVTMKWWDDIWLNESFATFMAFKVVDSIHPEWKMWEDFLRGETSGAAARDCLKSTHPVEVHVQSPDEIEQIFDDISYGKGASILRMVEAYIGNEAFQKGIQRYLDAHAYSNATGDDLWNMLEETSGLEVTKIMTSWIRQPGYPVITVSLTEGKLKLRQERFLISGDFDDRTWPIPITMELNGEPRSFLMENREQTIPTGEISSLKINVNRTGFYLVRSLGVDDLLWTSKLTAMDKWGIVQDAFAFLLSGVMMFADYLDLVTRFMTEDEFLPAHEISDQLSLLFIMLPSKMADFSKQFHQSQLRVLQDKKDENSSILRGAVASRLAMVDNDYAADLADKFREYEKVEPDMKQAVALAYARHTEDYDSLLATYRRSSSDEDRTRLLSAMTAFSNETLIKRALEFSLSGEVKRQDIRTTILAAAGKPNAKDVTWTWLKTNIDKLRNLYKGTGTLSGTLLSLTPILGIGRVPEVEQFFQSHKMPDAEVGISAGLEKLRAYDRLVMSIQRGAN